MRRADGVANDYTTAIAVTDTAIHEIDVLPRLVNDEWDEVQCICRPDYCKLSREVNIKKAAEITKSHVAKYW